MAEIRQFAAVHYFAMSDGKSNGGTRPQTDLRLPATQMAAISKAVVARWPEGFRM
jgi:hypothetical protein